MMPDATVCQTMSDNLSFAELWMGYHENQDGALDALLNAYLPLTSRVLERVSMRVPPHIAVEDLSQAALLGLYNALLDFNPHRGIPFEGYAYPRIRGAIMDELRSMDFLSRRDRSKVDRIDAVIAEWLQEHDEMPSEEQIAEQLEMSLESLHRLLDHAKPWLSLDAESSQESLMHEMLADPHAKAPDGSSQAGDMRLLLREAFRQLDMREQKILYLYYFEELRLSEIAALYELTEARISQIHALSISRLRASLSVCNRADLAF